MYYMTGWWLIFWIPLAFVLLWAIFAWWPNRKSYHNRGGFLRYKTFGGYPYQSPVWPYVYTPMPDIHRKRGRGPRGYTRSDQRILEDVCDQLTVNEDVDASDLSVRVEGGVVSLSGTVSSRMEKRIAESVAEYVPGVRDIRNEISVQAQSRGEAA